jgi:hypothetical protein
MIVANIDLPWQSCVLDGTSPQELQSQEPSSCSHMLSLCAKVVQGLLPFCDDGSKASLACLTKLSADPCNLAFVDGFGRNGGRFDVEKAWTNMHSSLENPNLIPSNLVKRGSMIDSVIFLKNKLSCHLDSFKIMTTIIHLSFRPCACSKEEINVVCLSAHQKLRSSNCC